jgi:hypothetical protein
MAQITAAATDADVKTLLASTLKLANEASLPPYWDQIIYLAHIQALEDIQDRLVTRGFSLAQIQAFDRLAEFERDIALYHALVKGAALEQYDSTYVRMMDRRTELATVMLTCNGIWQDPGGPVQTQEAFNPAVNIGAQSSADDIFGLDVQW